MTAATTPQGETAPPAVAAGGSKKVMLFTVAALVVGGALGLFVVGPKLHGGPKAAVVEKKKPETKAEPPRIVRLENIIVNPAGTQGQRFLIVSVAVEVPSEAVESRLKAADAAFRDAVTGLLSRMTLAQLTDIGARDSVRSAVMGFAKRFADDTALHVYIPQFLIQ